MQSVRTTAAPPLVSREWLDRLPGPPVLSSEVLGWCRIRAYCVKYPGAFRLELPAVGGLYVAVHLRGPCCLSARWNGKVRSSRSVPGETIIMSPNQENSWDCDRGMDELQIFLDPSLLDEVAAEVTDRDVHLGEGLAIRDPIVCAVGGRLIEEMSQPGYCSRVVGNSLALALAVQLLSKHTNLRATQTFERLDMPAHKVRAAIDYIEVHLGEDVSIEAMAGAVGMSPFRFARGFKKGTGKSPHQFLIERRIELAKELLRSSDRKLADIAREVGFSTQSHFTVAFRQRCNVTPRAYRESLRACT